MELAHFHEFSLLFLTGSLEKKPCARGDAPHSPSGSVIACSSLSGLPVSRGTDFADTPHSYQVTGADPAGSLWIVATPSPRISGSLCYSDLLNLVGSPGLQIWVLAE